MIQIRRVDSFGEGTKESLSLEVSHISAVS
jgi:hypothetical protein